MKINILSLEKAAMERWRNGDPWGFVELSSKNITYIDPSLTKPIRDLHDFTAYMQQLKGKIHYQGSEFINPMVMKVRDAAVLTYNYRSSVLAADGTIVSQIPWNATEVYFWLDGKWRIGHTHWSYINHKLPKRLEIPVRMQLFHQEMVEYLGEVMSLELAAMERWRKGDPWGFIEISAPWVTYFDTGTPLRINGREALAAEYTQRQGKIFYDVMEFIDPCVQVCGDLAVLDYRFLSTWLNQDGSVSHQTPWNCTEVFTRMDSQWRIIHTHWSLINGERI